jgi:NADPH-dependent ferric siderophore reductase
MKDIADADYAKQYTDWHIKTGGFARDMTLRDHFAGLAMQGVLIDEAIHDESDVATEWLRKIAEASYEMADAMLKERNK